jgi:heme-degrading monooxygenase HmoA
MPEPVPELVTLHLWRVPRRAVPAALARMAADRRAVRAAPGARFAKLLGTGRTFAARDADPRRWALLTSWASRDAAAAFERSAVVRRWEWLAEEAWRVRMRPLAARGRWSRREPFGAPAGGRWDGPVAAVTRARLAPRRGRVFWRAVPPVSADLAGRPGLWLSLGIGEAPLGLQGTFSLWESGAALREFAYAGAVHRAVVERTPAERWYAEELFARFAVEGGDGSVDGRDPLA